MFSTYFRRLEAARVFQVYVGYILCWKAWLKRGGDTFITSNTRFVGIFFLLVSWFSLGALNTVEPGQEVDQVSCDFPWFVRLNTC